MSVWTWRNCPRNAPPGLGVARVEFPHFGGEQVIEEERAVFGALLGWRVRVKSSAAARLPCGAQKSSRWPGVFENAGLDGFVFCGGGHA